MKLDTELYRLPLCFDARRLEDEVAGLDETAWQRVAPGELGETSLPLLAAPDGTPVGPLAVTPYLERCPYLRQVLAALECVLGWARLLRLPGPRDEGHAGDVGYYPSQRLAIHVPIRTVPEARWTCGDKGRHLAAGETWVVDNWKPHRLRVPGGQRCVHLVVATVGSDRLWDLMAEADINQYNQYAGSTLAANFSLIGSTAGITAITGANNQKDVSPGFTTFTPSDNGGSTPTLALPAGSPALANGIANGFLNDQRGTGFPRTVNGAVDIGAFETQSAAPPVSSPSPTTAPSSGGTTQTPGVSTAFGSLGPVLEVVSSAGVLTQFDATGAHVLSTGVAQANVAFGPYGEVLLITYQNGMLFQSDAFGAHFLGTGVRSADTAFGSQGEVLDVVYQNGLLVQYDSVGGHALAGDAASASVAFGPQGEVLDVVYRNGVLAQYTSFGGGPMGGGVLSAAESFSTTGAVLDIVYQNGQLFQYDLTGGHLMNTGVQSASAAFSPMGAEVLDIIFADGTLAQFDATGIHHLASGI